MKRRERRKWREETGDGRQERNRKKGDINGKRRRERGKGSYGRGKRHGARECEKSGGKGGRGDPILMAEPPPKYIASRWRVVVVVY